MRMHEQQETSPKPSSTQRLPACPLARSPCAVFAGRGGGRARHRPRPGARGRRPPASRGGCDAGGEASGWLPGRGAGGQGGGGGRVGRKHKGWQRKSGGVTSVRTGLGLPAPTSPAHPAARLTQDLRDAGQQRPHIQARHPQQQLHHGAHVALEREGPRVAQAVHLRRYMSVCVCVGGGNSRNRSPIYQGRA